MPPRKTILHVITGTGIGGAEAMLARTIEHADRSRFRHLVASLRGRGALAGRIEAAGAEGLTCLDIRGPLTMARGFVRLVRMIRREQPGVVQTWLAHGTLFGSLAALAAGNRRILWCIHTGNQTASAIALPVRLINRLLGPLSRVAPRLIVSVSRAAAEHCVRLGFPRSRLRLIPNGTDTTVFRPGPAGGAEVRAALGIPEGVPVVGIIGRNTREKDFGAFFQAALAVQRTRPETRFLLCGKGVDAAMAEAAEWLPRSPAPGNFHFTGVRDDMPAVYNACRIVVLTSVSEAFPLVLGEAMACGLPVAATDVGDCRALVGDAGLITPPGDPAAAAAAWLRLLDLPDPDYAALSRRARQRIADQFAIGPCLERYEQIYLELADGPGLAPRVPDTSPAATAEPFS